MSKRSRKNRQSQGQRAPPPLSDPLREALFTPCESKEALHQWIECYLDLDLPDTIVDEGSNSSPMDNIWTIYNVMRLRRFQMVGFEQYLDWSEVMAYSSRDSFKTVGAAILEVLVVLHLSLSVAHMAAIESQARKAQSYVKDYFSRPYLREFVAGNNERKMEVIRYVNRTTRDSITEGEFAALLPTQQLEYDRRYNYIVIIICTLGGANSEHVPVMVVDEIDVIRGEAIRAFEEAKLIPSAWQGCEPLTLYTSTRKSTFGLVQKELDNALKGGDEGSGLKVFHWNIIDVTEKCPPERHLPEEPRIPIYTIDPERQQKGTAISQETFDLLPDDKKPLYKKREGYAGCLANCKLFFACKGQLATKQRAPHPATLLKSVNHTTKLFRKVSPGTANAQLLCRKPSEEGLIYPYLDNEIHLIGAQEMAEKVDGEAHPEIQSKKQLMEFLRTQGLDFISGLDHGYTHNFVVVTGARDAQRLFVIDCLAMPGLELEHKKLHMKHSFTNLGVDPRIWPDTADPEKNTTLRKAGFKMQTWKKGADSVTNGIEIVRSMIYPAIGQPTVYFLKDDEGVELLFARLSKYHWEIDDAGRPTNIPDEEDDDECDAFRYMVMNNFNKGSSYFGAVSDTKSSIVAPEVVSEPTTANYLSFFINQAMGTVDASGDVNPDDTSVVRSGGFIFDMS